MSLNLRDDMEPPPQPGKYSTGIGIFLGLLLTLGLHFMQLVLLPLAYASEGIFKERAFVPLFFFGFTQLLYMLPVIFHFRRRNERGVMIGLIIGASLTFLLGLPVAGFGYLCVGKGFQ